LTPLPSLARVPHGVWEELFSLGALLTSAGGDREVDELLRAIVLVLCLSLTLGVLFGAAGAEGKPNKVMKGRAVYYSDRYKGQTMACGGKYHPRKMVAAHRSLPCGAKVRVTRRGTNRFVTVTVKDRGPYGDARTIIDLSRRAAHKLGYLRAGSARVSVKVVR
jgi:rare lipoprotein A